MGITLSEYRRSAMKVRIAGDLRYFARNICKPFPSYK